MFQQNVNPFEFSISEFLNVPVIPSFLFILDQKQYPVQINVIRSVSPTINDLLVQQPNHTFYVFQNLKDPYNYFPLFLSLLENQDIEINEDNCSFLYEVAQQLGIKYLMDEALKISRSITLNLQTVFTKFKRDSEQGIQSLECAEFIAQNFWKQFYNSTQLYQLPLFSFPQIFSTKYPVALTLDWIKNLIEYRNQNFHDGHDFTFLFGYLDFTKFKPNEMTEILDIISYDSISLNLWNSLLPRLISDIEEDNQPLSSGINNTQPSLLKVKIPPNDFDEEKEEEEEEINIEEEKSLPIDELMKPFNITPDIDEKIIDGIMNRFQEKAPNQWRNLIRVIGCRKEGKLLGLLNYSDEGRFVQFWDNYDSKTKQFTKDSAWITIYFPCHQIILTHYQLAAGNRYINLHPKSWKIDGSNDNQNWTELARETNCHRLYCSNAISVFDTNNTNYPNNPKYQKPFQYFRLSQIENHSKSPSDRYYYEMTLSAIEFYGKVIPIK